MSDQPKPPEVDSLAQAVFHAEGWGSEAYGSEWSLCLASVLAGYRSRDAEVRTHRNVIERLDGALAAAQAEIAAYRADAERWRTFLTLDSLTISFYGPPVSDEDKEYGGHWISDVDAQTIVAHVDAALADSSRSGVSDAVPGTNA